MQTFSIFGLLSLQRTQALHTTTPSVSTYCTTRTVSTQVLQVCTGARTHVDQANRAEELNRISWRSSRFHVQEPAFNEEDKISDGDGHVQRGVREHGECHAEEEPSCTRLETFLPVILHSV